MKISKTSVTIIAVFLIAAAIFMEIVKQMDSLGKISFNQLSNLGYVMLYIILAVSLIFFSTRSIFQTNWHIRNKLALIVFILLLVYPTGPFIFGVLVGYGGAAGPGSSIVVIFPILGAIVGYILGLIADLTKK